MTTKTALITGVTGQDGSYLSELLLEKGYNVVGLVRRTSTDNTENIRHLINSHSLEYRFNIETGDLTDSGSLDRVIEKYMPEEIYNLAAMSFVPVSWDSPEYTYNANMLGTLRILEAIKRLQSTAEMRFYQASTSEMFGKVREMPQNENTPFYPRSPYGVAKVGAFWTTVNYRESYDLYAVSGILFNHESPRRGIEFVTRKITHAVACIANGIQKELRLGNLDAKRDWGHSKDYVRAMWMMLQQDEPEDFVVGTGETRTVREFCDIAFSHVGLNYEDFVVVDPKFYRPAEVDILLSDPTKAREKLGWTPELSFEDLVHDMVDSDLKRLETK